MKQTKNGDSSPGGDGEGGTTEEHVRIPKAALDVMEAELVQARMAFDGETAAGKPDRLAATALSLLGLSRLLEVLDPADTQRYRAVAVEGARGLFDLWKNNQTPEWLQPQKKTHRPVDASEKWARRAAAVIAYDWLTANDVTHDDALKGIRGVLDKHGMNPPSARGIYGWREKIREGRTPADVVAHYKRQVVEPPTYASPDVALEKVLAFLRDDLVHRGHPKRPRSAGEDST
jgi:hypothetical protein